jgi:hypothetical protein
MMNTPRETPIINPNENWSMPATLLLSASSAADEKTLRNLEHFFQLVEKNYQPRKKPGIRSGAHLTTG